MTLKQNKPPRWIGSSEPMRGSPGDIHSMRVTKENWKLWKHAASSEGKTVSKWLHEAAAERLARRTNTNT